MQSQKPIGGRAFACLTVIVALLIVYGSLYPFEFGPRDLPEGALAPFLASLRRWPSKGDFVANLLLYMPLGFFGLLSLPPRLAGMVRWLSITFLGTALSIGIEFAQIWDQGRVPSVFDIVLNATGAALGAAAGLIIGRDLGLHRLGLAALRPTPILLLMAWVGYRFAPFVPALDFQQFKDALKPLLLNPTFPPLPIAHHAIHWLAIACLLDALFKGKRAAVAIIVLAIAANALALLTGKDITAAATTGLVIGLVSWFAVIQGRRWRTGLTAGLFFALYLIEGLSPFEMQSTQAAFHWDPFHGFLNGSVLAGIQIFLEKTFTYGAMLWLLMECRLRLVVALLVVVPLVSAIEWAQTWLPGRTAEITDPLMVILAGVVIALVDARGDEQAARRK
jgi:VanZ family protein